MLVQDETIGETAYTLSAYASTDISTVVLEVLRQLASQILTQQWLHTQQQTKDTS